MKIKILILLVFAAGFIACNKETSIQEYYVQHQQDHNFVAVDIPTSMFTNYEKLEEKQQQIIKTIKKINVLAYPIEKGKDTYEKEKQNLEKILKNEKYQLLMKYGSGERKAEIYFTGEEDAIDEVIVFGFDNSRGIGLARVLGEDMNPQKLIELFQSLKSGDLNMNGFKNVAGMFEEKESDSEQVEEAASE